MVLLDFLDRKPVEILRIDCGFLTFDAKGRIDQSEKKKEARLAVESLSPIGEKQESNQLLDARHRFARKRYNDRVQMEAHTGAGGKDYRCRLR